MGSGEIRMEIKPRIVWSKWWKQWLCFLKEGDRIEKVGFGKTFQEAYKDWTRKQLKEENK